jgi:hypothetical protein
MTPQAKRIAIAEACGYTHCYPCDLDDGFHALKDGKVQFVPNYFSDLNAMHEVEKVLSDEQWEFYQHYLGRVAFVSGVPLWRTALSATAAQRAEAFGLTLGLWT